MMLQAASLESISQIHSVYQLRPFLDDPRYSGLLLLDPQADEYGATILTRFFGFGMNEQIRDFWKPVVFEDRWIPPKVRFLKRKLWNDYPWEAVKVTSIAVIFRPLKKTVKSCAPSAEDGRGS